MTGATLTHAAMLIGDSPCADSTPRFSRPPEASRARDCAPLPIFSTRRCPHALWRLLALLLSRDQSVKQRRLARTQNRVKSRKSDTSGNHALLANHGRASPNLRVPPNAPRSRIDPGRTVQDRIHTVVAHAAHNANRPAGNAGGRGGPPPRLRPREQRLLDDGVDAPVAVHYLR